MIPETLIKRLKNAHSVVVLTGVGVSAESGVATFRGDEGLWKKFRPEELANINAFIRNPDLVWEWYLYRRKLIHDVEPNPGHFALSKLEKHFKNFTLITQNVDGLHQSAGNSNLVELHGNILRSKCIECNSMYTKNIPDENRKIPQCSCGGMIRPDVVWFGEMLPAGVLERANRAAQDCDLFFSIGTSAIVYPAAALPGIAKQNSAFVVEINPEPTPVTGFADLFIQKKSGEALPAIVKKLAL